MNNLTVRGITIRDSPMFHIVSQGGSHKRFSNLSLLSGCGFATAPNTDGFNLGGDDIIVSNSHVRNGDDCLPFGGSNLLAERVTCECGNSPGLYMDASTNITYRHHTSLRTAHGANLKAVGGGGGTVSNVLFDGLTIVEPQQAALVIDAFGQWAAADDDTTAARGLGVGGVDRHSARNVTFRNVVSPPALRSREKNAQLTRLPLALTPPLVARSQVGHGLRALGYFICRPTFPCSDIAIRNLTVASLAPDVSRVLPIQCGKPQRL